MPKHLLLLVSLFATATLHAAPPVPTQTETDKRLPPKGGSWGLREATVTDASLPRVLLIGDSITNSYMNGVRKNLEGKANIDAWITPTTQADKSLPGILEAITKEHSYAVIHFNLGLHGWQKGRIPEGQYEPLTRQMVQNLKKDAPKAKLIWATITPVTEKVEKGQPVKGELNKEIQPTIEQHNAMALKVMKEEGVSVDDLSSLMLQHLNFAAGDMFHWKKDGVDLLVKAVSDSIAQALPQK
jgi:lysophospholipase L1-like esterase